MELLPKSAASVNRLWKTTLQVEMQRYASRGFCLSRNELAGTSQNGGCRAAEDDGLEAIVVIEVGVEGADDEIVVLMLQVQQAAGDCVLVVVVDVGNRCDAPLDLVGVHQGAAKPFPDQVPHGL